MFSNFYRFFKMNKKEHSFPALLACGGGADALKEFQDSMEDDIERGEKL